MAHSGRERTGGFGAEVKKSGHLLVELSMPSLRSAHSTSCYYRLIAKRAATGESIAEHDPVENWITRAEQVSTPLATAISKKINKSYSIRTSLKKLSGASVTVRVLPFAFRVL